MSKKNETFKTFNGRVMEMLDEEDREVKNEVSQFYEDGILVDLSEKNPFTKVISSIRQTSTAQTFTDEQMLEKCLQIRENIKAGKTGNIELDFVHGTQKVEGKEFELGSTIVKAVEFTNKIPIYLYYDKNHVTDALAFIGGEDAQAFFVAKDTSGKDSFIRLSEIHLLSISENSKPEKEVGLMTSYLYTTAKIFSSIILAPNLDPVKNLLLAEGITANASKDKKVSEIEEGDKDEYF